MIGDSAGLCLGWAVEWLRSSCLATRKRPQLVPSSPRVCLQGGSLSGSSNGCCPMPLPLRATLPPTARCPVSFRRSWWPCRRPLSWSQEEWALCGRSSHSSRPLNWSISHSRLTGGGRCSCTSAAPTAGGEWVSGRKAVDSRQNVCRTAGPKITALSSLLPSRFFKALPLAEAGEQIYMGEGEIQLFDKIVEVFNFSR